MKGIFGLRPEALSSDNLLLAGVIASFVVGGTCIDASLGLFVAGAETIIVGAAIFPARLIS